MLAAEAPAARATETEMSSHPLAAGDDFNVRATVMLLLVGTWVFTAANIGVTLYGSDSPLAYWTQPAGSLAELLLIVVPRLVMLCVCWCTSSVFFGTLLYFKTEPSLNLRNMRSA